MTHYLRTFKFKITRGTGSVADPGSSVFMTTGSADGEKSGSGTTIPDHIFKSLETIFWVKILKFFLVDPELFQPWIDLGWKNSDPG